MDGVQRQAANLLVDAVSAFDSSATDDANAQTILTVLDDLQRIGAIPLSTRDDDSSNDLHVEVDVSNIVTPACSMLMFLVSRLATVTDSDSHAVIADLRDFVNGD